MPAVYTALVAPVVKAELPGMTQFVKCVQRYSNGALWSIGTFAHRDIKGQHGKISNHAKGIAVDLSYRRIEPRNKGVVDGRAKSLAFVNECLHNWQTLGIMLVIDYYTGFGRSWRCDRAGVGIVKSHAGEAWRKALKPTFAGAPGGDWWHVEITTDMAHNPQAVKQAFANVFKVSATGT